MSLTIFGIASHLLKTIRAELEELVARETRLISHLRTTKKLSRDCVLTLKNLESLVDIDALYRTILIRDESRKCDSLRRHVAILKRGLRSLLAEKVRLQVRESRLPARGDRRQGIMADGQQSCWWKRKLSRLFALNLQEGQ